jgi:hypothetical protein
LEERLISKVKGQRSKTEEYVSSQSRRYSLVNEEDA